MPGRNAQVPTDSEPLSPATQARLEETFSRLPLYFVENQGQLDGGVAYYIQGHDKTIYFTPDGVTFALTAPLTPTLATDQLLTADPQSRFPDPRSRITSQRWTVKLGFVGANPDVRPTSQDKTEAVISYFKGSPEEWHAGLPTYSRIVYRNLWPGIDLVYYGTVDRLKYEFVVRPGADPARIRLAYRGATGVSLNAAGQLEVTTPLGAFTDDTPIAYQEIDGQQVAVPVAYQYPIPNIQYPVSSTQFTFSLGAYDPTRPLVLDPAMLVYCGYIGGSDTDYGDGIAVDGAGYAYVTGWTWSSEATFPVSVGPDLTFNSSSDAFVAKVSADGAGLVYAGYIGGSDDDLGLGIAVDGAGNAYVTGRTRSSEGAGFPVTVGPDLTHNGLDDAFVAKVRADGAGLVYAGYIGGSDTDQGSGLAVDGVGNAYVTGWTWSSEATFPVSVGPDLTHNGLDDAFVAKVRADGEGLVYAGYIGGSTDEWGKGLAVDGAGYAYVTGWTLSSEGAGFPVTVGPDLTYNGGEDVFVAKVRADGAGLVYAGYIGGSDNDQGSGLAVDGAGNAYATGRTRSSEGAGFPVTVGPDLTHNGLDDAFVAKVRTDGAGLVYCGYIGGSDTDYGEGLAVDGVGYAYVTGWTDSSEATFPVTVGPDLTFNGSSDAFVTKVSADGAGLVYSGYIGGSHGDAGRGLAVDGAGNAYVMGHTNSSEAEGFPVTVGPDLTYNGHYADAFVARVSAVSGYSVSGHAHDLGGTPIAGVLVSAGASGSATTAADGTYTISGVSAGTYTLTPSKTGYTFSPPSRIVSVPPDATGQDFSGYDKPPIVFVHGWHGWPPWGSCEWPDPDEQFASVDDDLRAAGYYVEYARLETSPCYTPPLVENVPRLRDAITLAKAATGQDKVILIAHSMGGLVSRAYLEPDDPGDVEALFTFGSPHQGVPVDLLVFLANGLPLIEYCDYQPAACDFSVLGMILFNRDRPNRAAGTTYHVISGDAPLLPRSAFAIVMYWLYGGPFGDDDGLVATDSGRGLGGIVDRWTTDEVHGSGSGPRSYFIRDGGQSTSYAQCLKPVLVDETTSTCGSFGALQATEVATATLAEHTSFEYGTLLSGQTTTRTISLEGGPTLFAAQWQTGTLELTLVDPDGQLIDPAYAASHPDLVTYEADTTVATYHFPDAMPGAWKMALRAVSLPPDGSAYTTFAAFGSSVALTAGTDHPWYAPGSTATITASLSGSSASAAVTATILYADRVSETLSLSSQGAGQYQGVFVVPNAPGYGEVRLVATGTTATGVPFERGLNLAFQVSPDSVALTGAYSDTPQPRTPGSSFYEALSVTVGIEAAISGTVGLSADLVTADDSFVAHSFTLQNVVTGTGVLTLRFDGDDIYASRRDGPYTLTNLLLTDHRGPTLVVVEAEDVYTTAAYNYRSFGRGNIYLPLILRQSP